MDICRNIKGAADSLPSQQVVRNRIIDTLKINFEAFGYAPIETAQVNYLDLLSYKYSEDAEILREIYKIKDQGERDLGLRFDLTVPFCKFIAMNRNLRMPFKRYEIGKVFRNGPVKHGRAREFYQCDVDCVGASGAHIEAELILLAVNCFKALGIEPIVKIGDRARLVSLVESAGARDVDAVVAALDRMEKVSAEQTRAELRRLGTEGILDVKYEQSEETRELFALLEEMGIAEYCVFSPYLARGLNIYTGTVWEVYDKAGRVSGSLGAGGRYDNIIGNFIGSGQKYPAVGMSFGLEPIYCALLKDEASVACVDLMLIPMGAEVVSQKLAQRLRAEGLRVLVYLGGKAVGKAFEYANAERIPFAAVVGENEINAGELGIKNMQSGEQKVFKIESVGEIKKWMRA